MRLLDGPPPGLGAERLDAHRARLAPRPTGGPWLIDVIEQSGLVGRGGAGFPTATKWRAVAGGRGPAVAIANGAEGEPLSRKDQELMERRPHLVLDGLLLAAESEGAERAIVYVDERHARSLTVMVNALRERADAGRVALELLAGPAGFVTGEESAVVNFVNRGVAAPVATPPRVFESGVDGRPTLVQNVETLARTALLARGHPVPTVLVTVSGSPAGGGVHEFDARATLADVVRLTGGRPPRSVLLGGHFGTWIEGSDLESVALEPTALRRQGLSLGCGVIHRLDADQPPLVHVARVMRDLAGASAAQCGPCFFGLRALAQTTDRFVAGRATIDDLERLRRWAAQVQGRGACRHPDGAALFLLSALRVFEAEFEDAAGQCARSGRVA